MISRGSIVYQETTMACRPSRCRRYGCWPSLFASLAAGTRVGGRGLCCQLSVRARRSYRSYSGFRADLLARHFTCSLVSLASVFDAYRLAIVNNYLASMGPQGESVSRSCQSCGRPIDGELEFCQWCATRATRNEEQN